MAIAIWWARRDLRLADNQALHEAMHAAETVLPVFILDPALLSTFAASEKRLAFLFGGLRALEADLRARGSRLIVRRGDPATELARLVSETGATAVFAEEDVWPYARRRDTAVAAAVAAVAPLRLTPGLTVHPSDVVRKADGGVYTVFTPYSRAWKALPPPRRSDLLPEPCTSRCAAPRSRQPVDPRRAGPAYPASHFRPASRGHPPSRCLRPWSFVLGPSLRRRPQPHGSRRHVALVALPALRHDLGPAVRRGRAGGGGRCGRSGRCGIAQGAETWLNELIWREFYMAILYSLPARPAGGVSAELRAIPWSNDPAQFAAWCEGRTGYPIVDAAMRQLVQTGWMHNRARMIVASFLVKDLLIDWRWGERFFMQHLIDGDPAANNGGWQWTAGAGTDAAPYFRVFNPTLQAAKFDPDGAYVRRWVPELARVPDKHIHAPWLMPLDVQRQAGCVIGQDYPAPIVEHGAARDRVLAAYRTR